MVWEEQAPTDCVWSGGACLTRASLKRRVHETQEAIYARGLSERALEMAERRYHQALTALMEHHCSAGDEDERSREARTAPSSTAALASDTPADIAEIEQLIDRVCRLYGGTGEVAAEYIDARLVLRTRILMLMANQRTTLLDILEENERGDTR